jgi:hypothetical protein
LHPELEDRVGLPWSDRCPSPSHHGNPNVSTEYDVGKPTRCKLTTYDRTVLVRYLQWVNSVAYQVPISYVTPLSIGIVLLGVVYQLILTLDAYRIKNNIQIFVHCICNVCLSVSTVMQYGQIKNARDRILVNTDMYGTPFAKYEWRWWDSTSPALITCNVTSCLCSVIICSLAYFISREFSWKVYQQVSPDREIRRRYSLYQVSRATLNCSS